VTFGSGAFFRKLWRNRPRQPSPSTWAAGDPRATPPASSLGLALQKGVGHIIAMANAGLV